MADAFESIVKCVLFLGTEARICYTMTCAKDRSLTYTDKGEGEVLKLVKGGAMRQRK